MISNLNIKNFQSHENTNLSFHKNINVIVGKSDSGKTAIIRALNWLLKNRPAGDSFIQFNKDKIIVELKINDNKIKKIKSKKENKYIIDKKTYKAFGADVPDDVNNITLFNPINIQYQLDPPFLLSKSPGEISKYINKIIKFDVIDEALFDAEKMKREYKNEEKILKEQVEDYTNKMNNLNWLEKAIKEFNKLNIKYNNYLKEEDKNKKFFNTIISLKNIDEEIKEINKILKIKNKVDILFKDADNHKKQKKKNEILNNMIINIKSVQESIDKKTNKIKNLKNKLDEIMPNICPLCGNKYEK